MSRGLTRLVLACLVTVLLAQAMAVIVDEPWPEGRILWRLSLHHGVVVGDLPAVALVGIAGAMVALWRCRSTYGAN